MLAGCVPLRPHCRTPSAHVKGARPAPVRLPRTKRSAACRGGRPRVIWWDASSELTEYEEAWDWQHRLVDAVRAARAGSSLHAGVCLLVQHPPVYTLGSGASLQHLRFDPENSSVPVHRTERGGEVTYHGPGQLVLYPILDLRRFTPDLHWYMRRLEDVAMRTLADVSGLEAGREPGLTGVWAGGRKVSAIGIRSRAWVTYHGLALNVAPDLRAFDAIVPCGLAGRAVTSVRDLVSCRGLGGDDATRNECSMDTAVTDGLMAEYAYALRESFGEVFGADMETDAAPSGIGGAGGVAVLRSVLEALKTRPSTARKRGSNEIGESAQYPAS